MHDNSTREWLIIIVIDGWVAHFGMVILVDSLHMLIISVDFDNMHIYDDAELNIILRTIVNVCTITQQGNDCSLPYLMGGWPILSRRTLLILVVISWILMRSQGQMSKSTNCNFLATISGKVLKFGMVMLEVSLHMLSCVAIYSCIFMRSQGLHN